MQNRIAIVVPDVKAKTSRVNVLVAPQEESAENRLGQEVKYTVEYGLTVGRDDVSALGDTPSNWVQEPEEGSQTSAHEEAPLNIAAELPGVQSGFPSKVVDDVEERSTAKGKVCPLVAVADEGTNKSSDDHDLINANDEKYSRPGHARGQQQIEQQERSCDEPVNVSSIEDGAVGSTNFGVASEELDSDGGESQVGTHGEVCNGGNKDYTSSQVVENTIATLFALAEDNEDNSREGHGRADGEVEVRSTGGDGYVSRPAIDSIGVEP